MKPREEEHRELLCLLGAVRDGHLTTEQQGRINDLLTEYPELQQYYVEFTLVNVELRNYQHLPQEVRADLLTEQIIGSAEDDTAPLPGADDPRTEEIRDKAQRQLDAFLDEQEALRRREALLQTQEDTLTLRELMSLVADHFTVALTRAMRIIKGLTVAAAIIMICFAVTRYVLDHRVVATLDEELHAQWAQPPEDANLHPGVMTLEQGFARITFKQGTQILVQAPCTFDLRSKNRMRLDQGMVTANVPEQAHGFSIQTPHSTVTDFGTEFGVQVKDVKASEVHVFEGRVQCRTAKQQDKPLDITRNNAGVLSASGDLTLKSLGSRPNLFTRELPDVNSRFGIPNKRLDLTDIVGGGNGFGTGQRLHCIDPATGEVRSRYSYGKRRLGQDYTPVSKLLMVDGVFVPPVAGGFALISSSGYHYEFPPAAGGGWWTEVASASVANLDDVNPSPLKLGEQIFGQDNHPALLMHANVGITFDLDAIRKTLSGTRIRNFKSYCGVSHRATETGDPVSEFYVLVDGELKYRREIAMRTLPTPLVQVRLNADNRFLTLVCLSGEENNGDWSFFGEPALELERIVE